VHEKAKLDGKVAIVTGAGSSGPGFGIGKAISVLLAREGAKLVLVDKVEERAAETLTVIEDEGGTGTIVVADLVDPSMGQVIVDQAVDAYGRVDILVNNAAVTGWGDIIETSLEQYELTIAVNLTAPFMLCKAAIPVMLEHDGGSIVNITSIVGMRAAGARQPAYAAAKAGLAGMTREVAGTFGPQGIRVNCIAPGMINTPMRAGVLAEAAHGITDFGDRTALGHEGDAWDVARAVLFLAGPDGRYITGLEMPVDGGTTIRC
jgi:NAD(P)-dependent dehydrogenase (short-subunit alcohol dehydrogenase family)